ncbi:MAG: O-antigen ligase family protein [Elusimicrobia bacterium]|nr:O-antigen ligase family protein [Elusimicrobiota bacterium]
MKVHVPSRLTEGLLLALTAFGPLAFGCVEPWSRAILQTLAFLLALACFLRGGRPVSTPADFFWLWPAAMAALGAVQCLWPAAPDAPRPPGPFTAAPHATRAAVLLWCSYAALLWSVPRIITTHQAARRYTRFLFGLGIAVAAIGLLEAVTGSDKLYWVRDAATASVFGSYYDRDHAANLLLMSIAAGLGILLSQIRPVRQVDGPLPGTLRSLSALGAGIAFVLLGLAVCASRGAFAAIPLAGCAVLFLGADFAPRARTRRLRAAAAVAGAAAVFLLGLWNLNAVANAGAIIENSIAVRFSIYGRACRWWLDSPLFGTGLGSFAAVFPSYQDLALTGIVEHAHSDWLEIALEGGLCGLGLASAAALFIARTAARSWRQARSREMRCLIAGALAAGAAFSAHSLVDFSLQIPGNAAVFFGIVGFLLSAPAWMDKASERTPPRPPAPAAAVLAGVCFLFLAREAARPAAAAWQADPVRAYALEARPLYLERRASRLGSPRLAGGEVDAASARAALGYALTAAEMSPFDCDALRLAAQSLLRLRRPADAIALFERAQRIRFPAISPSLRSPAR